MRLTLRSGLLLAGLLLGPPAWAQEDAEEDLEASSDTGDVARLPLDEALAPLLEDRLFSTAELGIQLVDVASGDEVWAWRADETLVPASVTKSLTTAVALRTLGPGYTFKTDVYAVGEVDADGVLAGDLVVRGGGDPTLVVEQVWKLVRDLHSAGVVEVDGDVIFDDTIFEPPGLVPGWNKKVDEENGPTYFAPLGGLSVNYNALCVLVAPGSERGAPAKVDLETPADVVRIENNAVTGSASSRSWLKVERTVDEDGGVTLVLSGNVPLDADVSRIYRSVGDPTAHFISVFKTILAERGIVVTGSMRRGELPDGANLLARHASDPLATVLADMNKRSSNIMAEHVLRAVGAASTGEQGSTEAGIEVMRQYLAGLGIPDEEFNLVNGSGLSRDVRLRASHITAVLVDQWHDRRTGPEFVASMAIAGVDGTLRRRLDSDSAGLMRGKTGSLNSVYCLAGYLHGGDGRVYAFAFLVNGFSGSTTKVRALQDRFAQAVLALPSADVTAGSEP